MTWKWMSRITPYYKEQATDKNSPGFRKKDGLSSFNLRQDYLQFTIDQLSIQVTAHEI